MNLTDYLVEKVHQRRARKGARARRVLVWLTHSWPRATATLLGGCLVLFAAGALSTGHSVWGAYRHVDELKTAAQQARDARAAETASPAVDPSAPAPVTTDDSEEEATPEQRKAATFTATQFVTALLSTQDAPDPQARAAAVETYTSDDVRRQVAATRAGDLPDGQVTTAFADPTVSAANSVPVAVTISDGQQVNVTVVSDGAAWVVVDFQVGG